MRSRLKIALGNRRALAEVARFDHPRASELSDALSRGLRQRSTPAEQEWIDRIEAVRGRMERSQERVRSPVSEWSGDPDDKRVLDHELGELTASASKRPRLAAVLFALVRAFVPKAAIELGTCVGISCAYHAAALRLNGGGKLWSFEASNARSGIAGGVLDELGLADEAALVVGRFQETLGPTLASVGAPVDYAFVDGHHDEAATWQYFEQLAGHAAPHCLFVFDDISWSEGMERVWSRIAQDERVAIAVDLGEMGVCLLGGSSQPLVSLRLS